MTTNPFYILGMVLLVGALFLAKNSRYAAFACFLVGVLALWVGTYH